MKVDHFELIKRSFSLAFKNKWLILIAVFLASISISNNLSSFPTDTPTSNPNRDGITTQEVVTDFNPQNIDATKQNEAAQALSDFSSTISSETTLNSVFFVFFLISLAVVSIIIKIYASNFATGNFYYAIKEVDEDEKKELSLTSLSKLSKEKVWKLFLTYLYAWIIFAIPTLIILTIFIVGTTFVSGTLLDGLNYGPEFYLLTTISIILFIVFNLIYYFSSIYWEYLVLFRNIEPWNAFKMSVKYSFKNFLDNFVYGCLSCVTGCLLSVAGATIIGIVLGILALVILGASGLALTSGVLFAISVPFLIVLVLGLLSLMTITSALTTLILGIYKYLFNKNIVKEENL